MDASSRVGVTTGRTHHIAVSGAGDRPSSDRRSHPRDERQRLPSVVNPPQIHTVAWVNKWSQRAMKSLLSDPDPWGSGASALDRLLQRRS